jgi:hypothetical protein
MHQLVAALFQLSGSAVECAHCIGNLIAALRLQPHREVAGC